MKLLSGSISSGNISVPTERREVFTDNEAAKANILIIEDEAGPREALKMILRPFFNLYSVDNPDVAMQLIREQKIDLVTLDLKLPRRQGMDLLQEIKREREDVEVIIITGYGSLQSAMEGIRYGAAAYLLKPFNVTELIEVINQTLEKKRRFDCLRDAVQACAKMWGSDVNAKTAWRNLSNLLEAKHPELVRHANRVNFYASLLGEHLKLSEADRESLEIGACLHDIGKVGLDERTFATPHQQVVEDVEVMRRHTEIGARMAQTLSLSPDVMAIIRHHHEYYDGSGYPDGLRGEDIPYLARLVCIANEFDWLLTSRSEQDPLVQEEAREYVRSQAGLRFDPKLAKLFAQVVR
jgi:putative two-component system response regulator